jgi:hypothetical protein
MTIQFRSATTKAALASLLIFAMANPAAAETDGINALVGVAQRKAENANGEALAGADRQRELVQEQRRRRERARSEIQAPPVAVTPQLCPQCTLIAPPLRTEDDEEDDAQAPD